MKEKRRHIGKENPENWKYVFLYRFLPLLGGIAVIILLIFLPYILSFFTDHDSLHMQTGAPPCSYSEALGMGELSPERPVFLLWQVSYTDAEGSLHQGRGMVEAEEAARRKMPGDVQQRFETILQSGSYYGPFAVQGDSEVQRMAQELLNRGEAEPLASVRFGGGERYAQARANYGGTRIDAVETQVYEDGLMLLLVQDAFYNRKLYYTEDKNLADALRIFAMTYAAKG